MDFALLKEFGFPIFCVLCLGYACWQQFTRMNGKVDAMELYMRNELAEMVKSSHNREKQYVDIIRSGPMNCPARDRRHDDHTPVPHDRSEDDTQMILAAVDMPSRPLRGTSGHP